MVSGHKSARELRNLLTCMKTDLHAVADCRDALKKVGTSDDVPESVSRYPISFCSAQL